MKQIWSPKGKKTACIFRPELNFLVTSHLALHRRRLITHEHLALVGTWNRVGQTNVYLDANMNKFTYCKVEWSISGVTLRVMRELIGKLNHVQHTSCELPGSNFLKLLKEERVYYEIGSRIKNDMKHTSPGGLVQFLLLFSAVPTSPPWKKQFNEFNETVQVKRRVGWGERGGRGVFHARQNSDVWISLIRQVSSVQHMTLHAVVDLRAKFSSAEAGKEIQIRLIIFFSWPRSSS